MMNKVAILELTRDQILERIEKGAWHRLKMPAAQMLRAYRAGTLEDPGRVADLLALASLLPNDDPIFAER